MMGSRRHARRQGFSLVELLTVVGIIALLISILIPSLSMVRENARKARTAVLIKSSDSSLEAFRMEFNDYPESARRADPFDNGRSLDGAHWFARAMTGIDGQGIDVRLRAMEPTPITMPEYNTIGRHKPFFDDQSRFRADNDPDVFRAAGPNTGQRILLDDFDYPIIYYKANPKAMKMNPPSMYAHAQGTRAVYNLSDNEAITGKLVGGTTAFVGWDFAGKKGANPVAHPLAEFGDTNVPPDPHQAGTIFPGKGQTFISAIHDHQAGEAAEAAGNTLRPPARPDSYLLISPGPDGLYGTNDDVNNFGKTL